jgi:hypothetical protein
MANKKQSPKQQRKPAVPERGGAAKVTISLYPKDLRRIREIQLALLSEGVLVTDSQALRLPLRSPFDTQTLLKTRDAIKSEDARRRP